VDVDIAILDTGVDTDHPDLNVVSCQKFIGTSCEDGHGHGTHVSGTACAKDNDFGVVGVAPGCRIWAYKVLDDNGGGTFGSVAAGVDAIAANSDIIDVANMSLAGSGSDDGACGTINNSVLHASICGAVAKGVVFVVAAGNNAGDSKFLVPAAYDEVITMSALADFDGTFGALGSPTCRFDQDDTFADFSNFGENVDLIAPGVCIFSTYKNGGYATLSGTSMSSPHGAGTAALFIVANGKPVDEVGTILVKEGLIALGIPMNDPKGWSGDKDPFPEPLLWAASSTGDPVPPPTPPPPPDTKPPLVSFMNPKDGDTLSGKITVSVGTLDSSDIISVQLFFDNKKFRGLDQAVPYDWPWQTKSKSNGEHTLEAIACDAMNNCSSVAVTFTISNLKGSSQNP